MKVLHQQAGDFEITEEMVTAATETLCFETSGYLEGMPEEPDIIARKVLEAALAAYHPKLPARPE